MSYFEKKIRAGEEAPPWVAAENYEDGEDARVFGVVFAVQLIGKKSKPPEPWLLRGVLRQSENGIPTLSRVTIDHLKQSGAEVTIVVARAFNYAKIRDRGLEIIRGKPKLRAAIRAGDPEWKIDPDVESRIEAAAVKAAVPILKRGPKGYGEDHYKHIAERYSELVERRVRYPRSVLIAEETQRLGRPVTLNQIKGWLDKATELGFLNPGRFGVATARRGPKLNPPKKEEKRP